MNIQTRGSNHPGNVAMLPFSNLQQLREQRSLMFVRGKGIFTFDENGKDYIEAVSTFYCVNLGFSDDELVEAAVEQLRSLPFYPSGIYRTVPVVEELAQRLVDSAPVKGGHVMFATTGSEANDQLLKFTWYANRVAGEPKRRKIISRRASYHGGTIATTALGGSAALQEAFGISTGDSLYVSHPTWPIGGLPGETEEGYCDRLIDELRQTIEDADPETVAAFIAEPMSVSSGMFAPPVGYFAKVRALLDEYGIRLFADEVVTGFGRTGKMWGSQALGVEPDCLSCAKGLSGAYQPISAVVMSDEFYSRLEEGANSAGIFNHGGTYGGHPVSAAVALKVFDIYERRNILGHVQSVMPLWTKALKGLEDHPLVTATRSFGLAGAVQIAVPGDAKLAAASPSLAPGGLSKQLYEAGLEAGIVVRPLQGCVVMAPPLIITADEITELARRLRVALDVTLANLPR